MFSVLFLLFCGLLISLLKRNFFDRLSDFLFCFCGALLTNDSCCCFSLLLLLLSFFLGVFLVLLVFLDLFHLQLLLSCGSSFDRLDAIRKFSELRNEETVHVMYMRVDAFGELQRRVEVLCTVVGKTWFTNLKASFDKLNESVLQCVVYYPFVLLNRDRAS